MLRRSRVFPAFYLMECTRIVYHGAGLAVYPAIRTLFLINTWNNTRSSTGRTCTPTPYFHAAVPCCSLLKKKSLLAFRDLGSRKNRQQTRLMYLVEEIGLDAFRNTVVEYTQRLRPSFDPLPARPKPSEPYTRRDISGIHPQKQEGKSWVCVGLNPVGRMTPQEVRARNCADERYRSKS